MNCGENDWKVVEREKKERKIGMKRLGESNRRKYEEKEKESIIKGKEKERKDRDRERKKVRKRTEGEDARKMGKALQKWLGQSNDDMRDWRADKGGKQTGVGEKERENSRVKWQRIDNERRQNNAKGKEMKEKRHTDQKELNDNKREAKQNEDSHATGAPKEEINICSLRCLID